MITTIMLFVRERMQFNVLFEQQSLRNISIYLFTILNIEYNVHVGK